MAQLDSVSAVNRLKQNEDRFDGFVNRDGYTSSEGFRVPGVQETLYKISSFTDRGAWAANTVYAVKDLVKVTNEWYVALVAHTSGSTFLADAPTKWRLYSGANKADLAAPGGAATIGSIRPEVNATAQTVQEILNQLTSTVMGFGAVSGVGVNNTAAFIKAKNATSGRYHIPTGFRGVLDASFDIFSDNATAGDNVFITIAGTEYNFSNVFASRLRWVVASSTLTWLTDVKTGNQIMGVQNGTSGTATYFGRTVSIQTDSHCLQFGPKTATGSVDILWQRSDIHPTDPAGNRFNQTYESGNDRMVYSYATSVNGTPAFNPYMRVVGGPNAYMDFPGLRPTFRQGIAFQNIQETGFKLVVTIGDDRHHFESADASKRFITMGSAGQMGFFGSGGITRPTITGSRSSGAAFADMLTKIGLMGIWIDGTSA